MQKCKKEKQVMWKSYIGQNVTWALLLHRLYIATKAAIIFNFAKPYIKKKNHPIR